MRRFAVLAFLAAVAVQPAAFAETATAPSEVWDLTSIFESPEAWAQEVGALTAEIDALARYQGTLGKSPAAMLEGLAAISAARQRLLAVSSYASMALDEDLRVSPAQERQSRAQALGARFSAATAFVRPEILALRPETIARFRARNPELNRRFGFFLEDALRSAPHTLGEEAETALAAVSQTAAQPRNIYQLFANGELPFPTITLSSGEQVRLDQAGYGRARQAPNRADRKAVFDAFWGAWKPYEATLGATLGGAVIANTSNAKARGYESALSAALFANAMPEDVYRTLVRETNAALPTLHRYLRLRRDMLGITDPLAYYDIYPALVKLDETFDVARSKALTLESLAPLGPEYLGLLEQGFAGRWMHVRPAPGKRSGAYMNGSVYDAHPFILLNHHDDYDSLSTFAHEWGHAVHTMLSRRAQPFETYSYSTFIAETASIMNEMLLQDHLIKTAKTDRERLAFLTEALEAVRGTYFRQVSFAEFQLTLHEEVEAGRPLSGARMSEIYCDILKRYYGSEDGVMVVDPAYCMEWAFIPHFYQGFYVYQYATSIAGAALLAENIVTGGPQARETFLDMLRAGGSAHPYDIYKTAGLDMASPAPYRALAARMNAIMDEIAALRAKGV